MPNLLNKIETSALAFMDKRLHVENSLKLSMEREIHSTMVEVKRHISTMDKITLFSISALVHGQIKRIVEEHKANAVQMIDDAITNNFQVGIDQASKFLDMTDEVSNPISADQKKHQEILLALTLYGKNLITGLYDDMFRNIDKDLTSTFIIAKSQSTENNDVNRDTENDSTIGFILTGSVLANAIDNSAKNITYRSDTISQTESNRSLNHGILLLYIAAKKEIQELKVKWVEVNDNRLCQNCRDRANGGTDGDGVYSIDDVSPPPLHPNCRCVLIPFLYKWFIN
jgi:hypothetical protein